MVFHRFRIVFVGIPKTGTSSIYDTWRTNGDGEHHHLSITEIYARSGYENIKDYYTFAILRNPYDRFVSMAHQYFRDKNGDPTTDANKVATYIAGKSPYELRAFNEMFVPQWKFLTDEHGSLLVKNFWLFERLEETYAIFAKKENQSRPTQLQMPKTLAFSNNSPARRGKSWSQEINHDTIEIINNLYAKDFELFGFKMITP
jgi:hypothetical protein